MKKNQLIIAVVGGGESYITREILPIFPKIKVIPKYPTKIVSQYDGCSWDMTEEQMKTMDYRDVHYVGPLNYQSYGFKKEEIDAALEEGMSPCIDLFSEETYLELKEDYPNQVLLLKVVPLNHIKKLVIPGSLEEIPDSFFRNKYIDILILERGIKRIGDSAFSQTALHKLELPSTLEYIGDSAFFDCGLREVRLNKNIKELGDRCFGMNYISKFTYPKNLYIVNLDVFVPTPVNLKYFPNLFSHDDKEMEITCHFQQIDTIKCEEGLTCNLSVIVDDDFDLSTIYTFLEDLEEKNHKATIKKLTLIGYHNIFELSLLRLIAKHLGIEIEIEMIKEKKKNEEEIEVLEDGRTIQEEIHPGVDKEINQLVDEIREKSNILEESLKKSVNAKVNALIKQYKKDLKDLKPQFEKETTVTLKTYQTPQSLRLGLISELQAINMNFVDLDESFALKGKIEKYKKILEEDHTLEEQKQIESIEDKIKQIQYYASLMNQESISRQMIQILIETENRLLIPSLDNVILKTNTTHPEQELIHRVDDLFDKVRDAFLFYQSLGKENGTSLGSDIKELEMIINLLDPESKKTYQEKWNCIKDKYLEKARNLQIDSESELDLRQELMVVLSDLSELVPNMEEKRSVLDDIRKAKKVITESDEQKLGAITSTTKDIMSMLEKNNLDESLKQKMKESLLQILESSYHHIIDNTFVIEEKEDSVDKNLSWGLRATLQITKELYGIQMFINEMNEYNKNLESLTLILGNKNTN